MLIKYVSISLLVVALGVFSFFSLHKPKTAEQSSSNNESVMQDSESQQDSQETSNIPNSPQPSESPTPAPAQSPNPAVPSPTPIPTPSPSPTPTPSVHPGPPPVSGPTPTPTPTPAPASSTNYPWHTNITATVFWVGEPVGNGSSEDNAISAFDDLWQASYGGFDDYSYVRTSTNNYFPKGFTPKQNPFYLDLPFDDINDSTAYKWRSNIPWYTGNTSKDYSYMKNSWVKIKKGNAVCYGQIEDAGPYVYNDSTYVFGSNDQRPKSKEADNAGMDVSPALRDCLKFSGLNNSDNKVDWQFVNSTEVPAGPWTKIITTAQVNQP